MRDTYREQLRETMADLARMVDLVHTALADATTALLTSDLSLAEQVISNDRMIDDLAEELEKRTFSMLARQAPVAGELRTVFSAIRMLGELTRMGDLAAHVAKIARLRFPACAVPDTLQDNFRQMADVAGSMVADAGAMLRNLDVDTAGKLAAEDKVMDELRRDQFKSLVDGSWSHTVEAAVDSALLGRYYERIADHAVEIAERMVYVVTGDDPV
ncbi:phosphate signaling complex protein PhoU [Raineyella fluvialis]|uniref:Phosphate-specific transport system accessory protein PhoU n=1 Tax=Raineyella fluvialis TaxID=2662261 RepID=A0A5Q2FH07_9ACTN|nr:phosphate signaling complex protein PhoU [Raineyella fluvialis]QGF23985.1 phosphate signaling complex protein PhoU [Raineyella fluvialis]